MTRKTKKLSYITALLAAVLCLGSCAERQSEPPDVPADLDVVLREGEDAGQGYIDSFVFFGESTTYHLKSRGVLSGGTHTKQVWAPSSGTASLDSTVTKIRIVYPETGEELTVGEAVAIKRPERIMLTFGLNGAVAKIKAGEQHFRKCYMSLIDSIRDACEDTDIIIQSCFPIAKNMDMSSFSVDATTLNQYIKTINEWSLSLAREQGLAYLDTQEILTDSQGFLKDGYQAGDGYHLTKEAYEQILLYIRTHPYKEGI